MADFDTVGDTLATHFATQMASAEASVKIAWRNGPKLNPEPNPASTEWVRYSWLPIEDRAAAIGGSLYRGIGLVDVHVVTPLRLGTGAAERIGRSIQEIFRDQAISGAVVGPISVRLRGRDGRLVSNSGSHPHPGGRVGPSKPEPTQ